jgi:hypothetical protein
MVPGGGVTFHCPLTVCPVPSWRAVVALSGETVHPAGAATFSDAFSTACRPLLVKSADTVKDEPGTTSGSEAWATGVTWSAESVTDGATAATSSWGETRSSTALCGATVAEIFPAVSAVVCCQTSRSA